MMKPGNGGNSVRRWTEIDAAGIGAVAVLSALFYFAALKPILDHRDEIASQRRELAMQEQKAADAAISLQTVSDHLDATRKMIADNPQKLEPVRALNNRLARAAALASGRGLDIADIRPGSAAFSSHYTTVPIMLTGSGSFENCVRYLHELHQQFGDTAVVSVKLNGTPDETAQPANFVFELRWYAAAEPRSVEK